MWKAGDYFNCFNCKNRYSCREKDEFFDLIAAIDRCLSFQISNLVKEDLENFNVSVSCKNYREMGGNSGSENVE